MKPPTFAASILVLSEDGGGGPHVVRALARQLLRWLDPHHQAAAIDLEPEDQGAQDAVRANLYKGKTIGGHRRKVELARAVATKIMSPTGYVLIHIDADRTWGERQKNPSENLQRYLEDVFERVERHVDDRLGKQGRSKDKPSILSRLCLLSPHYSIESWLLQNTLVAKSLCRKHHRGRHTAQFDEWERDRGQLDELPKPKEQTCLKAGYNEQLASERFPARAAYQVGKSFTESADRLRACAPLVAALATTHPR